MVLFHRIHLRLCFNCLAVAPLMLALAACGGKSSGKKNGGGDTPNGPVDTGGRLSLVWTEKPAARYEAVEDQAFNIKLGAKDPNRDSYPIQYQIQAQSCPDVQWRRKPTISDSGLLEFEARQGTTTDACRFTILASSTKDQTPGGKLTSELEVVIAERPDAPVWSPNLPEFVTLNWTDRLQTQLTATDDDNVPLISYAIDPQNTCTGWLEAIQIDATTGRIHGKPGQRSVSCAIQVTAISGDDRIQRTLRVQILEHNDPPVWANNDNEQTVDEDQSFDLDLHAIDQDAVQTATSYQLSSSTCPADLWRTAPAFDANGHLKGEARRGTRSPGECKFTLLALQNLGGANFPLGSYTTATAIPDGTTTGIQTSINLTSPGVFSNTTRIKIVMAHPYAGDLVVTLRKDDKEVILWNRKGERTEWGTQIFQGNILNAFVGMPYEGEWTLKIADFAGGDVGTLASWSIDTDQTVISRVVNLTVREKPDLPVWTPNPVASTELRWGQNLDLTVSATDDDGETVAYTLLPEANSCLAGWLTAPSLNATSGRLSGMPGSAATNCTLKIQAKSGNDILPWSMAVNILPASCPADQQWVDAAQSCVPSAVSFSAGREQISIEENQELRETFAAANVDTRLGRPVSLRLKSNGCATGWSPALSFDAASGQLQGKATQRAVGICEVEIEATNGIKTSTRKVKIEVIDHDDPLVWANNDNSPTVDEDQSFDLDLHAVDPDVGSSAIQYQLSTSTCPADLWRRTPIFDANGHLKAEARRGTRPAEDCKLTLIASQDSVRASSTTPISIPDAVAAGIQSRINFPGTGLFSASTRIDIVMAHPYIGDLIVTLRKGDKEVTLWNRTDGRTEWGTRTFQGLILAPFVGTPLAGEWTLKVADIVGGDTGTLTSWSMEGDRSAITRVANLTVREKPDLPVWAPNPLASTELRWGQNLDLTVRATDDDGETVAYTLMPEINSCLAGWLTAPSLNATSGRLSGMPGSAATNCTLKIQAKSGNDILPWSMAVNILPASCPADQLWVDAAQSCVPSAVSFSAGREQISIEENQELSETFAAANVDTRLGRPVSLRLKSNSCTTGWSPALSFDAASGQLQGKATQRAVGICEVEIEATNGIKTSTRKVKIEVIDHDDPPVWADAQSRFQLQEDLAFDLDLHAMDPDINAKPLTYSIAANTCSPSLWRTAPTFDVQGHLKGEARRGTRPEEECKLTLAAMQDSPGGSIVIGTNTTAADILDNVPAGTTSKINIDSALVFQAQTRIKITIEHGWIADLVIKLKKGNKEVVLWDRAGGDSSWGGTRPFQGEVLAPFFGESLQGEWTLNVADVTSRDSGRLVSWSIESDAQSITRVVNLTVEEKPDLPQWAPNLPHAISLAWGAGFNQSIKATDDDDEAVSYSLLNNPDSCLSGWMTAPNIDASTGVLQGIPSSAAVDCSLTVQAKSGEDTITWPLAIKIQSVSCNNGDIWVDLAKRCVPAAVQFTAGRDQIAMDEGRPLDEAYAASNADSALGLPVTLQITRNTCLTGWTPPLSFDADSGHLQGKPTQAAVGTCEVDLEASNGRQSSRKTVRIIIADHDDPPVWADNQSHFTFDEDQAFDFDLHAVDPDIQPKAIQYSVGAQGCPTNLWRVAPTMDAQGHLQGEAKRGTGATTCPLTVVASQGLGGMRVLGSNETPITIPDNDLEGITSSITLNEGGFVSATTQIKVIIDHSWIGDLEVKLKKGEKIVTLFQGNGEQATWGTRTFQGPILSSLFDQSLGGEWQLQVTDQVSRDIGRLVSWSIADEQQSMTRIVNFKIQDKPDLPVWSEALPENLELSWGQAIKLTARASDDDDEPVSYRLESAEPGCASGWIEVPAIGLVSGVLSGTPGKNASDCRIKILATSGSDTTEAIVGVKIKPVVCSAGMVWQDGTGCLAAGITLQTPDEEIRLQANAALQMAIRAANVEPRLEAPLSYTLAENSCASQLVEAAAISATGVLTARSKADAAGPCLIQVEVSNGFVTVRADLHLRFVQEAALAWVDTLNQVNLEEDEPFTQALLAQGADDIGYAIVRDSCPSLWRTAPRYPAGILQAEARQEPRPSDDCFLMMEARSGQGQDDLTVAMDIVNLSIPTVGSLNRTLNVQDSSDLLFSSQNRIKVTVAKTTRSLQIVLRKGLKEVTLKDPERVQGTNDTTLIFGNIEELEGETLAGDWTLLLTSPEGALSLRSWVLTTKGRAIQRQVKVAVHSKPDPLLWSSGIPETISLKSGDKVDQAFKAEDDDPDVTISYQLQSTDANCSALWHTQPTLDASGRLTGRVGVVESARSCEIGIKARNSQNEEITRILTLQLTPVTCSVDEIFDADSLSCKDARVTLLPVPAELFVERTESLSLQVVARNNSPTLNSPIQYSLEQGNCSIAWQTAPAFSSTTAGLLTASPKAEEGNAGACDLTLKATNSFGKVATTQMKLILIDSLEWNDAGPNVVRLYRGEQFRAQVIATDRKSRAITYSLRADPDACGPGWSSAPTISSGIISGQTSGTGPAACTITAEATAGTSRLLHTIQVRLENCPTGSTWNSLAGACQTNGERTIRLVTVNGLGLRFQVGYKSASSASTFLTVTNFEGVNNDSLSSQRCVSGVCEGMVTNKPGVSLMKFRYTVSQDSTTIDKGQVIVDVQNTSDRPIQRDLRLQVAAPGRVHVIFKTTGTDALIQLPSSLDAKLQTIRIGRVEGGRFANPFLCLNNVCEGDFEVTSERPQTGSKNLAYFQYQAEAVVQTSGRILQARGSNAVYIDLDRTVIEPGPRPSSNLVTLTGTPDVMKQDLPFTFSPTILGGQSGDRFILEGSSGWLNIDSTNGKVTGTPGFADDLSRFVIAVERDREVVGRASFTAEYRQDPFKQYAWHLFNDGQTAFARYPGVAGFDINLVNTIRSGITGRGIRVAVSDEGLEIRHPDLIDNVDLSRSRNYGCSSTSCDPHDTTNPSSSGDHGTSVAGLIGAKGWNNIGSRGVAPDATLFGLNFLDYQTTENEIHQYQADAHIVNQSWGYPPVFSSGNITMDPVIEQAIEGVLRTKGTIFVKAAGNDHNVFGMANIDPANSHRGMIIVSALNAKGLKSSYSSTGANVWISAPGGEYGYDNRTPDETSPYQDPAMVTTDQVGCGRGYDTRGTNAFSRGSIPGNTNCNYISSFNGTSAATPVTSGAIALLLQANPSLTWRDVKHILASTGTVMEENFSDLYHDIDGTPYVYEQKWITNAAGFHFHNWYGFGGVNVDAAVAMARNNYQLLKPEVLLPWKLVARNLYIPDYDANGLQSVHIERAKLKVETVQLKLNVTHDFPAELAVELISPSGTRSIVMNMKNSYSGRNFNQLVLLSNAFYGEPSEGNWTLRIIDGSRGITGRVTDWSIRFQGHAE